MELQRDTWVILPWDTYKLGEQYRSDFITVVHDTALYYRDRMR